VKQASRRKKLRLYLDALLDTGLFSSGQRLTPQIHPFIFSQIVLVLGMGLGVMLLLLLSGEYFRALRELDVARRRRLSNEDKA